MYGYDDVELSCWYRDSGEEHSIIWQWITFFGWVDVSILYCAVIITMVIRKLKSATENDVLESAPNSMKSCHHSLINQSLVFSVVRRVVWYPLVPLIVQFFNSLLETYAYTHKVINSSENNQNNDSKCDIILNNQNNDIHLIHPDPVHLKDSSIDFLPNDSNILPISDPLIGSSRINQHNPTNINNINSVHISTCTIDVDERQIDVMHVNDESTKSVSDELTKILNSDNQLSEEIESHKLMLRKI
ncbi:3413_t:CDS:2 [Cetraspora pellucida]|uniref:3413_t:CDS:1 n=1 Tax=Cetraspora pellucida TaxID=1433469 RepID=A0A9N8Z6Y2_9GLOM|nr:3413_t:CDS:2 [Cetraspora pellucida]